MSGVRQVAAGERSRKWAAIPVKHGQRCAPGKGSSESDGQPGPKVFQDCRWDMGW